MQLQQIVLIQDGRTENYSKKLAANSKYVMKIATIYFYSIVSEY